MKVTKPTLKKKVQHEIKGPMNSILHNGGNVFLPSFPKDYEARLPK
jgi:hypothetical protein